MATGRNELKLTTVEYLKSVKARMQALSPEDFALLVVAAATALDHLEPAKEIAESCNMSDAELGSWADRVLFHGDPDGVTDGSLSGHCMVMRRVLKGGTWNGTEWVYPSADGTIEGTP